jgi:F-type H+-transporting ATPase subunit delta
VRVSTARRDTALVKAQPRALARRYAKAVLEVAPAQGPGAAAALGRELSGLAALLQGSDELRRALDNPALGAEARRRVLAGLSAHAGASPLLCRLLDLVATHDHVSLLPALAEEYERALNQSEGRVSAEAVTATPLAEAQRSALAQALCSAVGKSVELKARVDPAVLGGVLVKVGGRNYDGTVRAQIAALRQRLASGR